MVRYLYFYCYTIFFIVLWLPLPAVGHDSLSISETPNTILRESYSALERPEGVAFSPSGKYLATTNSSGNSITFYERVDGEQSVYEVFPSFSIKGEDSKLNFPHDLSFSPDGVFLAVANRQGSSITIYKMRSDEERYGNLPIAVIEGKSSRVNHPNSVRFSPKGDFLAVANGRGHSITFYRFEEDHFDDVPYQIIKDNSSSLSNPNSLDFSGDGALMAVASLNTHSVLIYERSDLPGEMYSSKPVEILQGSKSRLCHPHSLSFHPVKNHLVITNAQGRNNINLFPRVSDKAPYYASSPGFSLTVAEIYEEATIYLIDALKGKGGCKGVVFSKCGTALAVTQNLSVDDYSLGALLVYSLLYLY